MTRNAFTGLFEHNNWANLEILALCYVLDARQLDAKPHSGGEWSIREVLTHLVEAQHGYWSLLTLPPEARHRAPLSFAELETSVRASGEGLLALACEEVGERAEARLRTTDGYLVEPWVVMVQAIHHATEHRRQIAGMLRALGMTPPVLDGWAFGEVAKALVPASA